MIPPEVTRRILYYAVGSCCHHNSRESPFPHHRGHVNYMLVSRVWCQMAAEHVWHSLMFDRAAGLARLVEHFSQPGSLSVSPQFVKEVHIYFEHEVHLDDALCELLDCMCNVHTMLLQSSTYNLAAMEAFVRVFAGVVDRVPNLQHLALEMYVQELDDDDYDDDDDDDYVVLPPSNQFVLPVQQQLATIVQTRALKSLKLHISSGDEPVAPAELAPVLAQAIANSPSLHSVKLDSSGRPSNLLPDVPGLTSKLTKWHVLLPPSSEGPQAASLLTHSLRTLARQPHAFSQLREFSMDPWRNDVLSSPCFWDLMEVLSTLPRLAELDIGRYAQDYFECITPAKPTRMLTFPALERLELRCGHWKRKECGCQHLTRFKWPSLKRVDVSQDHHKDEGICRMLQNAPRLKSIDIGSAATTKDEYHAFLHMLAGDVYPNAVRVCISSGSRDVKSDAISDACKQALQRAFPHARIEFDWTQSKTAFYGAAVKHSSK